MKKSSLFALVVAFSMFASCGGNDDKLKEEKYPTYDTTDKVENKNDTKNPEADNAQGDLRHNVGDDNKNN
jgi:hypothetical protein